MDSILISPVDGSACARLTQEHCEFLGKDKYPVINGIPVLIDEQQSLFTIADIISQKPQTQNKAYSNKGNLKNFIRTSILPKLNIDWDLEKRYKNLAKKVKNKRVLIIGAGDKVSFYKKIFEGNDVITSDVHLQFLPDLVFDVHNIPFKGGAFDLIIAAQVFEHTIRPWEAARELERVTVNGGIIQIEVPFAFPYHGAPYDFFRFTFTGMRSLFPSCFVENFKATEGVFSAVAVVNAQAFVDFFSIKVFRYIALSISRFLFFWLKYFDLIQSGKRSKDFSMPKGYWITFKKDGIRRSDKDCLKDFSLLK
jgi:SAM-dependent methyltransferase